MFKLLKYSAMVLIILLSVARLSLATPYTWVDSVANGVTLNGGKGHSDYSFIYDITGSGNALNVLSPDPSNPFHPGIDVISTANLSLNFSYGNGNSDSTLDIKLDGDDFLMGITIGDRNLSLASVMATLNTDGTVELSIHRITGEFGLTDSILTACGSDNTIPLPSPTPNPDPTPPLDPINPIAPIQPIPEPSTILIIGAGLLGFSLVRKMKK